MKKILFVLICLMILVGVASFASAKTTPSAEALPAQVFPPTFLSEVPPGCTYSDCMAYCTEAWYTCHTICNRDCTSVE